MDSNKKTYFISDAHLGIDSADSKAIEREKKLVAWLDEIKADAASIYLMGDIFDFWFEYKRVIPKGFSRFFGKISEITDSGIPVYYFVGNHDMWTFGYLEEELGVKVFKKPLITEINGKKFYIAHGDGLGPFDKSYLFLKKIFTNRFFQFLFRITHPDIGIKIANLWSGSSRNKHKYPKNINPEDEWLVKYARTVLEKNHIDYFIFGHRHIAYQHKLSDNSVFTNLGDWIRNYSYAEYDGKETVLKFY